MRLIDCFVRRGRFCYTFGHKPPGAKSDRPMIQWEVIVKQARDCHTKQAWQALFAQHGEWIASSGNSKPIAEIFKILRADPQCLQYDAKIWGQMIQGCLASWNLELGREMAEFCKKVPSAAINIPAAHVFLESGQPAMAREIANRALRLAGLTAAEKLKLEMMICSSYAEEGKRQRSIRLLTQIRSSIDSPALGTHDRADFLTNMGRMQFLLGRYLQAAELFYEASKLYRELQDWEAAAKAIFNTGACHLNGGTRRTDEAFTMIEECRQLAEAHNLAGPLAHCEAIYGVESYHHGDFPAAKEHLRRALDFLPISDKSYRRLHILSILAMVYLSMGRYHLAKKFGRQTLDLAALDESERLKSRYTTLQAELLWEDGLIPEAQELLTTTIAPLETQGVHVLEELSSLTRHCLQSAWLGGKQEPTRLIIDDPLKKHTHSWLDFVYALGQLRLNDGDHAGADKHFNEVLTKGRQTGDRYHEALGLLGLLQSLFRQRRAAETDALMREFEIVVGRLGETPLKGQVSFLHAGRAYQRGDFDECVRILRLATRSARLSFVDRFVLAGWTATIEGRSSRLTADWQTQLLARATRIYFAPTLEAVDERHFRVSGHYNVSLERHPSLAELLHYLMLKSNYSAATAEIQTEVWKQSLQTQGWQQKIRNTIMRLRDFFPQTMAPIIVHAEQIALFKEAISVQPRRREGLDTDQEILRLLRDAPMSSSQLSKRLHISAATTKRILKRLADEAVIEPVKSGRNVSYKAAEA
jgi:tetratricopeptide (TPR) repeat protein